MDLDLTTLKMPRKLGVNYDDHIVQNTDQHEVKELRMGKRVPESTTTQSKPDPTRTEEQPQPQPPIKKTANLMDDDDLFGSSHGPAETKPPQPVAQSMDTGLGGFSFESTQAPQPVQPTQPAQNDPFSLMGLDFGGAQQVPPPTQPNTGFGGDLLGFGATSNPAPVPQPPAQPQNTLGGGDLMGFGFPSAPQPQPNQTPAANIGGFSFDTTPQVVQPAPVAQPQAQVNLGFDMMGAPTPQVAKPAVVSGFQPITNTNPNKILAYQNDHVQIWMDCIK